MTPPPDWVVRRVLLAPASIRKAAARRASDKRERWMLLQPFEVRRSFVQEVLEEGGNPRTPAAFADQLRDLGWKVEEGEPTRKGVQLDVVVTEV